MNTPTREPFHILVVDDNPGDVFLLRRALKEAALDVNLQVITDGAQALSFINDGKLPDQKVPDLVILDLNLPKAGGNEVLQAMRDSELLGSIPVAVLSSSASPREREPAELLGAKFITKPVDLKSYLEVGEILKEMLAASNRCLP